MPTNIEPWIPVIVAIIMGGSAYLGGWLNLRKFKHDQAIADASLTKQYQDIAQEAAADVKQSNERIRQLENAVGELRTQVYALTMDKKRLEQENRDLRARVTVLEQALHQNNIPIPKG